MAAHDAILRRKIITLASATLAMFLLGAVYAYGVMLPALMTFFGWDRSTAALPHSVLLFVYAVGMGIGGALQDRSSPTRIAVIGGVLFAAGLLLASRTHGLIPLMLSYGVLGGIGFGFAYVSAVTAAMKSFTKRRGLAAGIVVGAFGLSTLLWVPLLQGLLSAGVGWQGVLLRFGILCLVLLPLLGLGIRAPWRPHDIPGEHPEEPGVPFGTALRTQLFWQVFVAYTLVTAAGLMLSVHLVNFGESRGFPALQAALLLSVVAVGSGTGRVVMGGLSDRIGRFPALIGTTMLEVVLLVLLVLALPTLAIFIIAGLAGFAYGTWLSLYGPISTDLFGLKAAGAIYGVLYMSYGVGGVLGPILGGYLADISGSYTFSFLTGATFCIFALLFFTLAMRQKPPVYPHPPGLEEEYPV